jgi:hypothetical protein
MISKQYLLPLVQSPIEVELPRQGKWKIAYQSMFYILLIYIGVFVLVSILLEILSRKKII